MLLDNDDLHTMFNDTFNDIIGSITHNAHVAERRFKTEECVRVQEGSLFSHAVTLIRDSVLLQDMDQNHYTYSQHVRSYAHLVNGYGAWMPLYYDTDYPISPGVCPSAQDNHTRAALSPVPFYGSALTISNDSHVRDFSEAHLPSSPNAHLGNTGFTYSPAFPTRNRATSDMGDSTPLSYSSQARRAPHPPGLLVFTAAALNVSVLQEIVLPPQRVLLLARRARSPVPPGLLLNPIALQMQFTFLQVLRMCISSIFGVRYNT
ncbi:hypothetical protein EDD18DRAFT_1465529 [Armillaria luteobubalina]|uniref:Uncharacterized protein n=1 Tax=Armillaria luteobubalina TaxID=153913 RepID=A0AA39PXG4_9AGAR|nr:hypothetical protein EDD18DRAFT_1465529 [Armillaria luteobubalina]